MIVGHPEECIRCCTSAMVVDTTTAAWGCVPACSAQQPTLLYRSLTASEIVFRCVNTLDNTIYGFESPLRRILQDNPNDVVGGL